MIIINKTDRDFILKDIRGNVITVKPDESANVTEKKAELFKRLYGFSVVATPQAPKIEIKKIKKKGKESGLSNINK